MLAGWASSAAFRIYGGSTLTREPLVRLPFRPPAAHVVQLKPLPCNVAF